MNNEYTEIEQEIEQEVKEEVKPGKSGQIEIYSPTEGKKFKIKKSNLDKFLKAGYKKV